MSDFVDSLVDLCRVRDWGEKYPSLNSRVPDYPYFTPSTNMSYLEGKPSRTNLNPPSRQELGDTIRMLTLASIFRTFPSTSPRRGFKYVAISDRGSGWIKLIQFLDTSSKGYVSANRRGIDFNYSELAIKSEYLRPFYGGDAMGNLDNSFNDFVNIIIQAEDNRIDSVMSDCSRTNPFVSTKVASKVLKKGGSLVLRINSLDEGLLYVISYMFEKVTIFRPLLQEVYIVATGFDPTDKALATLESTSYIVPVDKVFSEWVTEATKGINGNVEAKIDELATRRLLNV